jgi:Ecdysteroid kinase-like family
LKFLDWQVSRLGSVVIDIAYFVFCCTDENLRKRLPGLLKIYHKALTDRIDALGSDGNRLFSFERLEEHMNKFAKFGMGMCNDLLYQIVDMFCMICFSKGMALMTLHTTCCAELPMDVTETLDNIDLNQFESIAMQLIFRPEYKQRMSGVARDMLKFGYL